MNQYLVPANTKKSMLILGALRPFPDLVIALSGFAVSIGTLLAMGNTKTWQMLIACIPMIVCVILVLPIPYYHNTLVGIQSILRFYRERRNFIWKGWCIRDEFKETK